MPLPHPLPDFLEKYSGFRLVEKNLYSFEFPGLPSQMVTTSELAHVHPHLPMVVAHTAQKHKVMPMDCLFDSLECWSRPDAFKFEGSERIVIDIDRIFSIDENTFEAEYAYFSPTQLQDGVRMYRRCTFAGTEEVSHAYLERFFPGVPLKILTMESLGGFTPEEQARQVFHAEAAVLTLSPGTAELYT